MKLLKRLLYFILFLSALFMGLLFVCAWKPEVTDMIASYLYPDGQTASVAEPDGGTAGRRHVETQEPGGEPEADFGESMDAALSEDSLSEDLLSEEEDGAAAPSVYIPPEQSAISVPDEVAGKSGYEEIEENDSEIEEEEAQELEQRLGVGETGDGLTFDPLFYPYYAMLDETGKHIYRQIYANANALQEAFAPVEPIRASQLRNIISAVYNDHPELFWLDTAYACKHRGDGRCVEIDLQFNRTADNLEAEHAAFEAAADEILSGAEAFESDYDKERYVHDALVRTIDYATSAEMNQSAYSALVNGRTVCAGYARAFQYLMQRLGVPCYYCVGYAGENHAWDIVKLGDDYYNVDVTWDDTGDGTYDYFNKTDDDYAGTHMRQELSVNLPPCSGEQYRTANLTAENEGLRSSEEAGFSDEAVLDSLPEYYDDCYAQIIQRGPGSHTFSNVIEGEELFAEWEAAYNAERYKEEYMIEAMRAIGAKSCRLNLVVERLQQGRYLITHELQLH